MDALICHDVSKSFRIKSKHNGPENGKSLNGSFHVWQSLFHGRKDFFAVREVNFTIKKGEIFGVIGENGSGKSTLIRMISTLLYPSSGYIEVFGYDARRDFLKVRTLINRVSVDAAFYKKLSAKENLLFAGRLYGVNRQQIIKSIKYLLERVQFPLSKIDESMEDLSRGQQQKVAIARSLLTSPILLLLDEPTTGLDPRSKQEVQKCILDIRAEHDATTLLTTHDMHEADVLCDRIAILDGGQVVAIDTPTNLKKLVSERYHEHITLEEVFIELTGRRYNKDEDDEHNSS